MFNLTNPDRNHRAEENGKRETIKIVNSVLNKESGHILPVQMTKFQA